MASSSQQEDFLSTVEDYCGRIYRPPEVFVKQLALCSRCIGGKSQCKVLEETLLMMVSLVKTKLNEPGRRNKTSFQAWPRNAAKAMELYQVIGREWICANVLKLPDLPQRKMQEYDPTNGRRDIRFFPESEAKLLDLTEEENLETVDLDYNDEEQLLSISPTENQEGKNSSHSSRRSPRLLKKTVTQSSSENRTSPRKELQELQQKVDHAQACCQGKKSPRKEILKRSRAETCSQARKSSKESQKKAREDAQACI